MSSAPAATPGLVSRPTATATETAMEGVGGRPSGNYCKVPFSAYSARTSTRSTPRFGTTMSHQSFFSRHNPHPHRVRHIQGLNGNPVCMVRDDWDVTSSLFPHPLIRGQAGLLGPFPLPLGAARHHGSHQGNPGLLPEAWREELRELAAKVSLASKANTTPEPPPEDDAARRKTQYSAKTGRIIPPSTKAYQRRTWTQRHGHRAQPLYDQELQVLEVLCQILQTDSLSQIQNWLLLAGQREKDLVMGLVQQALGDLQALEGGAHHGDFEHLQPLHPCSTGLSSHGPLSGLGTRKPRGSSSSHVPRSTTQDRPEMIGEAEVLGIYHGEA